MGLAARCARASRTSATWRSFLSVPARTHNHFQLRRRYLTLRQHRDGRVAAFRGWRDVAFSVAAQQASPTPCHDRLPLANLRRTRVDFEDLKRDRWLYWALSQAALHSAKLGSEGKASIGGKSGDP
jgi:hypothetical protein